MTQLFIFLTKLHIKVLSYLWVILALYFYIFALKFDCNTFYNIIIIYKFDKKQKLMSP